MEVFGRAKFPPITESPYLLSLGPHAFYWFHLQPRETTQESLNVSAVPQELPMVQVGPGEDVFSEDTLQKLHHIHSAHYCAPAPGFWAAGVTSPACLCKMFWLCRKRAPTCCS